MKLQVDTINKTITLDEPVKVGELTDALEKLFPGEWKTFTIEMKTIQNWSNPIIIRDYPTWPYQPYWWTSPIYTTTEFTVSSNNGVYNLSV